MLFFYFLLFEECGLCYNGFIREKGEAMSEDGKQTEAYRQRRVRRLKKGILIMPFIAVFGLAVLCAVLILQVNNLSSAVERLEAQMAALTAEVQNVERSSTSTGQGKPLAVEAERGVPGYELEMEETDLSGTEEPEPDSEPEPEATKAHKVYLTFDDGPSCYTEDILDILDRYDVKATFFVVGKESDYAKELLRDIVARGHTLGMHSYSHKYADVYASLEAFAEDFVKLQEYLYEVTGVESTVYRFPGGSSNTVSDIDMEECAGYLDSQGVRFFDWNISSGDGGSAVLPVETLVENATKDIQSNRTSVILMHDSAEKKTTVEALPVIIENILAMEDTEILPITEDTSLVQHIRRQTDDIAGQN